MAYDTSERSIERARRKRHQKMVRRRILFLSVCAALIIIAAALISNALSAPKNEAAVPASEPTEAAAPAKDKEQDKAVKSGKTDETAKPAKNYTAKLPPTTEENNLVKIAECAKGTAGKKICYLTFDDGPTQAVTPKVLDTLKQYDVKATFFMVGKMIDADRELAKRAYDEGHLLANHSYSHDYKALYATADSFKSEIDKTHNLIKEITGEEPFKLIRFPGGSYNAGDHAAEKQKYKVLLKENGYYYADWNCLNGDAESSSRTPQQLVERLKATATVDNIVVLMHDAATKKSTAEALPEIIEYLKSKGYEFRRLDEIEYYDAAEAADAGSKAMVL